MNFKKYISGLLEGNVTNYIPSGFWIHFPQDILNQGIEVQARAHIDFAKKNELALTKVMNENEFRSKVKISSPQDWRNIKVLPKSHKLFQNQRLLLELVSEGLIDEHYLLGTVHGLVSSLSHSSGHSYSYSPQLMIEHANKNKEAFLDGIKATTENVLNMIEINNLSGVDGIFYAALGGERDIFSDEFFAEYFEPYDKIILNAIDNNKTIFLHMCKNQVELKRFEDYPNHAVNWAVHENNKYHLQDGTKVFPNSIIFGGLDDRSGVLVEGTKEDIIREVHEIKRQMEGIPFILGSDCTLPDEIEYDRILIAVKSINN